MTIREKGTYRGLIVWQKAMDLVDLVYDYTSEFPSVERFTLQSQMRRCAISIPSNIAEGKRRSTKNEFNHFLKIAFGSGGELETQLEIARRRDYGNTRKREKAELLLDEVMRMLNKMIDNRS